MPIGEPTGQPGRGRRGQTGHGREYLLGYIGAVAVQPDQDVLPGQLRTGHPDQQLATAEPPVPGFDWSIAASNSRIIPTRSTSSVTAIPENEGRGRIRRADPHPPPQPADLAYALDPMGVLPPLMIKPS